MFLVTHVQDTEEWYDYWNRRNEEPPEVEYIDPETFVRDLAGAQIIAIDHRYIGHTYYKVFDLTHCRGLGVQYDWLHKHGQFFRWNCWHKHTETIRIDNIERSRCLDCNYEEDFDYGDPDED